MALSKSMCITLLAMLITFSYSSIPIYGHIFSGDESASFLSLTDQIKSALMVISQNKSSDIDAIKEQGRYAGLLLNDSIVDEINEKNQRLATELPRALGSLQNISAETKISSNITKVLDLLSETISARVEKDQLQNTTIHALAVAENVDKVLAEYISAYNKSATKLDMNMTMKKNTMPNKEISGEVPNDFQAYYRSLELIEITIDRFNSELKKNSQNVSSAQEALGGLDQLRNAINNREPPVTLMGVVHGQIHPNLQKAFELQLKM